MNDTVVLQPPVAVSRAASPMPPVPRPAPPLVRVHDLTRVWGRGSAAQVGVDGVDLELRRAELVAIVGPSGSGKSTLGALLAGIDTPTRGSIVVDGVRIDTLKRERLAAWRAENVGIVFQDFHLLATLTARENVELALKFAEVLTLMAEGLSNTGIAERLVVSPGAVEKHISNVFAKLDLAPVDHAHRRVLAVLTYLRGGV